MKKTQSNATRHLAQALCLALLAGAATGCGMRATVRAPQPVRLNIPEPQAVDGSLWQPDLRGTGLVADATARRKGDLLTILVVEDTRAKRDRKLDTQRTQSADAELSKFIYPDYMNLQRKGVMPAISYSSDRSYSGDGTIEDNGTVKTTISAQVTEVMPNGNLIVLGQKEVVVSGETQVITLTGITRQEDVLPNNTILSTKVAEARISISGSGPLDSAQRRTLVGRALDWINLF